MLKQILLSGAAAALLFSAACNESSTGLEDCSTVRNDIQGTRGDTIVTASGLRYLELRSGTGAAIRSCRLVGVRYTGALANGTQFDAGSFDFTPGANEVIVGFEQGVIGMKVGGLRRLIIPPELGYGATPVVNPRTNQVVIPANSTLVFEIEAVSTN